MAFCSILLLDVLYLALATSAESVNEAQTLTPPAVIKQYPYAGDYNDMRPITEQNGTALLSDGILCLTIRLGNGEIKSNFDVTIFRDSDPSATVSVFFTSNMQCAEVPSGGTWRVVIPRSNGPSSADVSFPVSAIGDLAHSLNIESLSGQRVFVDDEVNFLWTFDSRTNPDFVCLFVVYGDNGPPDSFGPPSICQQWTRLRREVAVVHNSDSSALSIPLKHTYKKAGVYALAVFANNIITNGSTSLVIQVDEPAPCFPSLSLPENSTSIDSPLIRRRNQELRLVVQIRYQDCDKTSSLTTYQKQWEVSRIHMLNRAVADIVPLNLTRLYRHDEEIWIPPYALSFGMYKAIFSLSLAGGPPRAVFTYFRVTASPLIAMIYRKQSSLNLGKDQGVRLLAQSLSTNPNEQTDNQSALFDAFSWSCRPAVLANPSCAGNASCTSMNGSASCFRPDSNRLRFKRGFLNVKGSDFVKAGKYEVGVTISHTYAWDGGSGVANLSARSTLEVNVVEASSAVNITIDCGLPQFCVWHGDGIRINDEFGLALNSTCWDCNEIDQNYTWTVSVVFPNSTDLTFDKDVTGVTGTKSRFLSISPSFLKKYGHDSDFLQAEVSTSTATSVKVKIYLNEKPQNGTCMINPKKGTAIETSFMVQCFSWSDDDGVEGYSFYYREAWTTGVWKLLSYSRLPWTSVSFPSGFYEVLVNITDTTGGTSSFQLEHTVIVDSVPLTPFSLPVTLEQLSHGGDPMRVLTAVRAFSTLFAENSKWNHERVLPMSLDGQPFTSGPTAVSEFLGVDIIKLTEAILFSNFTLLRNETSGLSLIPVPMTDDPVASGLAHHFLHSTAGTKLLATLSQMINQSSDRVAGPESKNLPVPYYLFIEAFGFANISTNANAAIELRTAAHLLSPLLGEDVFGLVILDNQTSLDRVVIITAANVSRFVSERLSYTSHIRGHRDYSVGKLLIIATDGPMAIDIKYSTLAVMFLAIGDDSGESTILPVQISWYGVPSIVGRHAVTSGGVPLLHKLPGAGKWLSVRSVAEAVANLSFVHLPMDERAPDILRYAKQRAASSTVQVEGTVVDTLVKDVLQNAQTLMDVVNDEISKAYQAALAALLPMRMDSSKEANLLLETVIEMLDSSIRSTVNPEKSLLEPQTVISQDTMEAIVTIVDRFISLTQSEIDLITPTAALDVTARLLRLVSSMNKVLRISAQTPLLSDRLLSYKRELESFGTLSSRKETKVSSGGGQDGRETIAARRRAQRIGIRISKNQLHSLLELITVLLSRDKAALEAGVDVTLNETGAHMIFASGKASTILGNAYSFSDGTSVQTVQFPNDICQLLPPDEPSDTSTCDTNQTVTVRILFFPMNALTGGNTRVNSGTLDVSLIDPGTGSPISITKASAPIVMRFQPSNAAASQQPFEYQNQDLESRDLMNVHEIHLPQADGALLISFRLDDLLPPGADMVLFLKYGAFPGPWNSDYDSFLFLNVSGTNEQSDFEWTISSEDIDKFGGAGSYYIGVALVSNFSINGTTVDAGGWIFYSEVSMPMYGLTAAAKYCFHYTSRSKDWRTDGCRVSSDTSDLVACSCTHTTVFAAGVVPLPIQTASPVVLSKPSYTVNLSVYVTMIVLACAYVLLSVWARTRDGEDAKKHRSSAWTNNITCQQYEVSISMDTSTGTCSNAQLSYLLSGDKGDSDPQQVEVKLAGYSCKFVFDCTKPLGRLSHVRVWQRAENGQYLRLLVNKVAVLNLLTGDQYSFEGEQCLATSAENRESLFDLTPVVQAVEFRHYPRTYSLLQKILQEHLCLSIFARTQRSRMTRVQRLSCFMSSLLAGMVLVTLWHTSSPSRPVPKSTFGPFIVTWEEITVGVLSNVLAIPLCILITQLLKRSKRRRRSALKYTVDPVYSSHGHGNAKLWPWWCRILGYVLLALTIGGSALLIVLFGMQYADEKASRWLSSSVVCFLTSILITQPLEIIVVSSGFAICKPEPGQHQDTNPSAVSTAATQWRQVTKTGATPTHITPAKRILTMAFLIIILWAAYSDRTIDTFRLKSNLENLFVPSNFSEITNADRFWNWMIGRLLPALRSQWYNGQRPTDLKGFLNDKASKIIGVVQMRQVRSRSNACNRDRSHTLSPCRREYGPNTEDTQSYGPRWSSPNTLLAQRDEYEFRPSSLTLLTNGEIDSYSAGGYVFSLSPYQLHEADPDANFTVALTRLREGGWLDRHTRAVVIDLCAYNYQSDIFVVLQFLFETAISGDSFVPSYDIRPLRFTGREAERTCFYVHWTAESVFIICVVLHIFRQLWNILHEGAKQYFSDLWTCIEMVIISASVGAVGFYFLRLEAADDFFAQLTQNYEVSDACTRLRYVSQVDWSLNICLSLLVLCASLKVIHILKITPLVGVATSRIASQLAGFTILLLAFYSMFVTFFYLAMSNGDNSSADFVKLVKFAFGVISGKGKMKEIFGESSLTLCAAFVFACIHIMIFTKLASAIALMAYSSTKKSNLAEGNTLLTIFEHIISKVSRALLNLPSSRALDLKKENTEEKNLQFFEQRIDDLFHRLDQFDEDERDNTALIEAIIGRSQGDWDEVMEIGLDEKVGAVEDSSVDEPEIKWVVKKDNMYRLE